ncbi:MAG TPA: amidohydrolase family protein [Candidatus Acidoferrales bacterium]|nr:amidohydrolase family protein [Candidatus Acidoferrales bacterium]
MPTLHVRGRVLPGGRVGDVFVVDGRFTFAPQPDARTLITDAYLIPGLVDAHAHLGMASPAPRNATPRQRSEASAAAHLHAGVLVVREPGGPDRASSEIGPARGLPRVQTAGRFLAPPGRYFPGLPREIPMEELPQAAVEEAKASGSRWAKAIGDFPDEDGALAPNWTLAVLSDAVRAVHAIGARFAMHCVGAAAIELAIEAGVDTIEHGNAMTADGIREMKRKRLAWTPTLDIIPLITGALDGMLTDESMASLGSALDAQPSRVREAHEAGVRILAGTDAGMGPHGMVREEMRLLLEAGLPAEAVLAAGSWDARRYFGYPGIEEGAPADLVAFRDDPRDPDELAHPALIMLDGRVVSPA